MGAVSTEHRTAHIYLQQEISGEFTKVLAGSTHESVESFLEHLFDLYTKASKTTQAVVVREDVAQKFTALQCETRFQTSDDLMKHLLNLHVEHLKTSSNDIVKQQQQQQLQPKQERVNPRKSRKSQPKRNIKHSSFVDSDESCDLITAEETENPWGDDSVSDSRESMQNGSDRSIDLSRVKQETGEKEKLRTTEHSDKDSKQQPLCLMQKRSVSPDYKKTRQFLQSNWRSHSEPVTYLHAKPNPGSKRDKVTSLAVKEESGIIGMDTSVDRQYNDNSQDESYNYVLNSLANSPGMDGSHSNSLPDSPMMVPPSSSTHRYTKSISYTISSDDEERPEDLSFNPAGGSVKSQALVLTPSHTSQVSMATIKKDNNNVKYDSNANAVTVPMAQLPNGQFLSPTQIAVPQNLIFHDQRSVDGSSLVGQPQVLQIAQQEAARKMSVAHVVSSMNQSNPANQPPPPLFVAGLPRLQLVNVQGQPPPLIRHGANVLPKPGLTSPQALIPANSVSSSPLNMNQLRAQATSPDSGDQGNESGSPSGSRRKRKRVEDTTIFRDPPEQSLPFNGPNKYRFYCDVCDTGFTRKYTFNRHKCKGRVEKHYCQLCDKAYLSKYKLKDHILVKHEGQTVSCPECGKRFSSRSSMEMHKKQQHEGQYSIFCKICGKGFNHTGHYYGHMNKHTNTKPFWCQQCGKRFYGSSYLHNHKQVCRGNNDLNFACNICDRKFKCELYLKKHMKIHDSTPIIANPNVAKATDEDLAKAGVNIADDVVGGMMGSVFPDTGKPIFPNVPEMSDSNSSMEPNDNLIINENDVAAADGDVDDYVMKTEAGIVDGTQC